MFEVDVLIAGGGIAGLLVAKNLSDLGYRCMLLESTAVASEQSGHSHGYLHRGYIYLDSEALVRELRGAKEAWSDLISDQRSQHTNCSYIGFENRQVAVQASQTWNNCGLVINNLPSKRWPKSLMASNLSVVCRTDEQSFNIPQLLENLLPHLRSVHLITGSVERLSTGDSVDRCADIMVDGKPRRVRARFVILAAGTGNSRILSNTIGRFRSLPTTRTSFMMVIRGSALQPLSLILPEHQFYGLFLVSRRTKDDVVWLISNYLSYGGLCDERGTAGRTWATATLRTLDLIFPHLRRKRLLWGQYAAPKAEFRRDPEKLPGNTAIEKLGFENVLALWPTKLTLGPIIARRVQDHVVARLGNPAMTKRPAPSWVQRGRISVAPERWRTVKLSARRDFVDALKSK
jgi:hypothetical protein